MKKVKVVFYKGKWRELNTKKVGGKNLPKDSRKKQTVCYVSYKGRHTPLADDLLDDLEIKYI